jgi:hypothetical protein
VSSKNDLVLAEDLARFYDDPLGFVLYAYPWGQPGTMLEHHSGPDLWQREFLIELGEEVKKRKFDGHNPVAPIRMTRSSGHGIGKSVEVVWLVNWITGTRPNSKGTISASTFQQLSTRTWATIQTWTKLCICGHWFTVTGDRLFYRSKKKSWFVSAQSCKEENSESFAGQHAADSTSFYIFDEASAVPDKIFEVAEGGLTDGEPMIFLFGNPTRNSGKFFRVNFGSERERWNHRSVDSRTSAFTNKTQIAEWINDYGEDSDFCRYRIRGLPPRADSNALISHDTVATCRKFKSEGHHTLPKILSCDPARFGDDRSVIGLRQGRYFRILDKLRGVDTVQLAERVIHFIEEEEPDATVVDGDGIGAGVVDQINHRNFGKTLFEFHGGAHPEDVNKYFNKRSECWGLMADWLKASAEIPDDPEMEIDLTGPQYGFSAKNQIQLEKKSDLKSRGLASPDLGDTLAMTFGVKVLARRTVKSEYRDIRTQEDLSQAWMQ